MTLRTGWRALTGTARRRAVKTAWRREAASTPSSFFAEPNPFYDRVEIRYLLPAPRADVNLWVYDRSGHPVKSLLNAAEGGSRRSVTWDGTGDDGAPLKPGIYILFLETSMEGRIFRTRAPVVFARGL